MTKPTKEQINALKVGDRVLVEATFDGAHDGDDVLLSTTACRHSYNWPWVPFAAIHSILPREIKVGDRVRTDGDEWEVVAPSRVSQVSAREEVALWSKANGYAVAWVDELEIIA
jgi:signal peptidase I